MVASTDMLEISNLPDRLLTFYRGMQIGEFSSDQMTMPGILKQITDPFEETGL